jgi:hypothetical protein
MIWVSDHIHSFYRHICFLDGAMHVLALTFLEKAAAFGVVSG